MGALLDLLNDEGFRRRTAMRVGSYRFAEVSTWLRGFANGVQAVLPHAEDGLEGFREWLVMRIGGPLNVDCFRLLSLKFGDEAATTSALFEYLDQFQTEINQRGLSVILNEYRDYEARRQHGGRRP